MKARHALLLTLTLFAVPVAFAGIFGPKGESPEEKRDVIDKDSERILANLYKERPEAEKKLKEAVGYGTFNNKNVNLFMLSTGHGYGMVVDKKTGEKTYMRMGSLGGGVGMGAKDLSVVFIFKDKKVMNQFIESGWQFGGEASASAKAGDSGAATAREGGADSAGHLFEVYQLTDTGAALQATVAGTKYWKDGELN